MHFQESCTKSKCQWKKIIYKVFKFVMVCLKPHTSTSQDMGVSVTIQRRRAMKKSIHIPRYGCVGYNTKKKSYEEELCCMGKQKLAWSPSGSSVRHQHAQKKDFIHFCCWQSYHCNKWTLCLDFDPILCRKLLRGPSGGSILHSTETLQNKQGMCVTL